MAKYITLDTASDGNVHINTDSVLYVETASSTAGEIFLTNGTHKLTVTGTGFNIWIQCKRKCCTSNSSRNILD